MLLSHVKYVLNAIRDKWRDAVLVELNGTLALVSKLKRRVKMNLVLGEVVSFEGTGKVCKLQQYDAMGIWVDIKITLSTGEVRQVSLPIECINRFENTEMFSAPDGSTGIAS